MLIFLGGIIVVQAVTIGLFLGVFKVGLEDTQMLLTLGLLEILFSVLAAYWFSAIARQRHRQELATVREEHAREREKIRVNAERQKARVISRSQKQILRETRRAHAAANFKVGAAFAGALALGGVMLYSQLVTFGLLILATAGGGLAGYLARGRIMFYPAAKKTTVPDERKKIGLKK